MNVSELDARTDYYAKSDTDAFPLAEKLAYYNEANGILNSLIIQQQEDRNEEEFTKTTVADQREYQEMARIHNINWLKIDYGNGFIPARYISEAELIARYGTELESILATWDKSDPIYWYKGQHLFVVPAPSASEAGADRLKVSQELYPEDLDRTINTIPAIIPSDFHHLYAAHAAMKWLDEDDPLWKKAKRAWDEGTTIMLETIYPRARQAEMQALIPEDDGSNY